MTLFYCTNCHTVFAFNLFDITKHALKSVCDTDCPACGSSTPLLPVRAE